jgi:hypothetical protein
MTKTNHVDMFNKLAEFLIREQWDFTLRGNSSDGNVSLEIDMFDGTIILRTDGTWEYDG